MRPVFIILLILFCGGNSLSGQNSPLKWSVSLNALPLVDIFFGSNVRIGTEVKLGQNVAILGEGGVYLPFLGFNSDNSTGANLRLGAKWYYQENTYFSAEYFYKTHTYNWSDKVIIPPYPYDKTYEVEKYINSVSANWGKRNENASGRLFLEYYFGAGIRFRHILLNGLTQEEYNNLESPGTVYAISHSPGNRIMPEFRAGLRLGLNIKK